MLSQPVCWIALCAWISPVWAQEQEKRDEPVIPLDRFVEPPVPEPGDSSKRGKITVNFDEGGNARGLNGELLDTDQALRNYIVSSRIDYRAAGKEPFLFIRGCSRTMFKQCLKVITHANELEVPRVIFATYRIAGEVEDEKKDICSKGINL